MKDIDKTTENSVETKKETPMFKRVVALIGVVLLVGMYIALLVQALFGAPGTEATFIACVAATIAVPIAIWLILWVYTTLTGKTTVASPNPYGDKEKD